MTSPNADLVPRHTEAGLREYVEAGIPPGDFLRAVLENKLVESFAKADEYNIEGMPHIAAYLWNRMPTGSWGSPEIVDAWLKSRRAALAAP